MMPDLDSAATSRADLSEGGVLEADVPEADVLEAYVDIAAKLQGMPLVPEWRPGVVANLTAIAAAARLVAAFRLPDEAQPAPLFTA